MFAGLKLNFKSYNFTTKQEQGNALIFDIVRKKYVLLSPEEWVRQHVIHYLVEEVKAPKGLIMVEKKLTFNGLNKRFDVCVADRSGRVKLLVECKAPEVNLGKEVLMQAGIYQRSLNADFIFISNGIQHITLKWNSERASFEQLPALPLFEEWF